MIFNSQASSHWTGTPLMLGNTKIPLPQLTGPVAQKAGEGRLYGRWLSFVEALYPLQDYRTQVK